MANLVYPKDEIRWVGYHDIEGELRYLMTSKSTRDVYFLYELQDGKFVKLGKAKSPKDLEEKFGVDKALQTPRKKPRGRKKTNTVPAENE